MKNLVNQTLFLTLLGTAPLWGGSQVDLDVSMAQPTLIAQKEQTTFLKVGLTGFEITNAKERSPVNVAIVLDKSGSMAGPKLEQAKEAAINAVERLGEKDIVSIVAYDSTVSVIVPATKMTDRELIIKRIREIHSGGSTALFAGVSKGADEIRKFLDKERVNRVILLSDGLANVGPQSPSELGDLGTSLAKEGITVSTIGLGLDYNEDLMTKLAASSDGNHVFVEKSTELVEVFNREFNDVLSVVAQEVVIKIECDKRVCPVRVLNTDAEITGQDVYVKLNQLYSKQEKYIILEVKVPESKSGEELQIASVSVSYTNMETKVTDRLSSTASVNFSESLASVESSLNPRVMEQCVLQLANLRNQEATQLRDQGKIEDAERVLIENARFLRSNSVVLDSPVLRRRAEDNRSQAELVKQVDKWNYNRKAMRAIQNYDATQQLAEPVATGQR